MASKSFTTLSQDECSSASWEILRNSNRQWRSADFLSKNRDYGTSITILIFSIEELTKAVLLAFDSKGFRFRKVKGMQAFFRNHEIRYAVAFMMLVISIAGSEMIAILKRFHSGQIDVEGLQHEMTIDGSFFEKKYKFWLLKRFLTVRKEFRIFKTFNRIRQNGVYSDFQETFHSPILVSEKEYKEILERVAKVRYIGRTLIHQMLRENEKIDEILSTLRIDFEKRKFYDSIATALERLRKSKGTPFELLENDLSE